MRSDRRSLGYLLASVSGVVVAHVGDYLAVFPHSPARDAHLAATGHGYWPAASVLGVAAGVVLLAVAVSSGIRCSLGATAPLGLAVLPLALFQIGLFVGVEVFERLSSGHDVASLFRSPELVLGVVLQLVVAALVCRLTRTVERVAARVASRRESMWPSRVGVDSLRPLDVWSRAAQARVSPVGSRAPPSLSLI